MQTRLSATLLTLLISVLVAQELGQSQQAAFLQKFVGDYDWAHIDIAGVAWAEGANKGATGRPMGLMSEFLINESKT